MSSSNTLWPMIVSRLIACCTAMLFLGACAGQAVTENREVRIVRDEYGVPHVYSDSIYGLYFGYGYAIAQDRLFQIEMARRSTQGTVAAVLGAEFVDYDRSTRSLFDPARIIEQIDRLEPRDRDVFRGYADGVNAWLAEIRKAPQQLLPKQFSDFGFEPGDWTDYDVVMIFVGTMNNRYGDFNTELENSRIYRELVGIHGEQAALALFDQLNPRFTDTAPTSIPEADWSRAALDSLATAPALNLPGGSLPIAQTRTISGFSNCYVIGREKTNDGQSILVNGPQFGWFTPSYVYSVGLHGAGVNVVGNTPFGYPIVMFGHNESIAWGSTWGASDIVDLYREELHPEDRELYRYRGEYRRFEKRREVIDVRDGDPVEFELRRSVHGPVISVDRDRGFAYAKRRSWDGQELDTLLAWLYATWARDFEAWKAQAERSAINVNMYFADVEGNIGYFHGGWFPHRVAGHDNRFPALGDGSMDWLGRQDVLTANPHVLNPSSGFIANWNNKPGNGVMNPDFFFYSWSSADRVSFLNQALRADGTITPEEAWALLESSSYTDVFAPYFLPMIDDAVSGLDAAALKEANSVLQAWDLQSRDDDADGYYDEQASAIFRAFVRELVKVVLEDDLGDAYAYFSGTGYGSAAAPTAAGTNLSTSVKVVVEYLNFGGRFDLLNGVPSRDVIVLALEKALASSAGRLETAPRPFSARNFLGVPQASESEFRKLPIEQNRGTENNMIVLKPGAIVGWEVAPPGQSGYVAPDGTTSKHYDDQMDMYHGFGKKRMWFYQADVEANMRSETVLAY